MGERRVVVAIKPVAPVLGVDWPEGRARTDRRHLERTPADEAACAVGVSIATALGASVVVACVGGPASAEALRAAVAEGAHEAVRVVLGEDDVEHSGVEQWPSAAVAVALADVAGGAQVVVCGDASGDRGSGTVPALLAHRLGVPQALCLRSVEVRGTRIAATRRLDGGRREELVVDPPCVISVEPVAAAPRRAPLPFVLASGSAGIALRHVAAPSGAIRGDPPGTKVGPYRARPSELAAPEEPDAVRRAMLITGTLLGREPPEALRCGPEDAAVAILDRLARWGMR